MDLWRVTDHGDGTVGLELIESSFSYPSYIGDITEEGTIEGTVPQYIKIDGNTEFYPVTSMYNAFEDNTRLTVAPRIPNTVTSMSYTFADCSSLTTPPNIPNGVTSMYYTFSNCSSLEIPPSIPNGVTSMAYTFADCSSLTIAPNIPNGVTSMAYTFANCSSLTIAPTIPNTVIVMACTFLQCTNLKTVSVVPSSVTNMYSTFQGCSNLTGTIEINANPIGDFETSKAFNGASTAEGASLTVTGSSTKLDKLIATKSNNSNITKGN